MTASTIDRRPVTPPSVYAEAWRRRLLDAGSATPTEALSLAPGQSVLAVGAHPDDETLAMGATLAHLAMDGVPVHVLSATSGEAALDHVGHHVPELARLRRTELLAAGRALRAESALALDLPDGFLQQHTETLVDAVLQAVTQHSPAMLMTLWRADPHPDHQAAAQAVLRAGEAVGLPVVELPLWAVHWTDPAQVSSSVVALRPAASARLAKAHALAAYASQTEPLLPHLDAVLPPSVLGWPHEILVRP